MERELLLFYLDKPKIKLSLNNGFGYTGEIKELGQTFLILFDKYGGLVTIDINRITSIEEVIQ